VPTIDELPTKLAVIEIRGLLTGRDCPHMKDLQRRKTTHQLAFSLVLDSVEVSSLKKVMFAGKYDNKLCDTSRILRLFTFLMSCDNRSNRL